MQLVVLTETTACMMLARGLARRPMFIAGIVPHIRLLSGLLDRLAAFAIRRGLARGAAEISDTMPWIEGLPGDGRYNDIQMVVTPRLPDGAERFSRIPELAETAYAMRKAGTDYTAQLIKVLVLVKWMTENFDDARWRLAGATPHMREIFAAYFGRPAPFKAAIGIWARRVLNAINLATIGISTAAWLLARTRAGQIAERRCRVMLDTASLLFEQEFLSRCIDRPDEAILYFRNKSYFHDEAFDLARTYAYCLASDARASAPHAARLLRRLARDLAALWRHAREAEPGLFGRYCALAGKRVVYAAFFERYRPRYFFLRDDYTLDHIIRNQELRKIGGTSIGLCHGIPTNTYVAEWCEVDCDIYHVFGRHMYETFYRQFWPANMKIVPSGAFRMTAEYSGRAAHNRSRDIAYFPIVHPGFELIMRQVFEIARHFADRTVYIKMKKGRDSRDMELFARLAEEAPKNIVVYDDRNAYELLLKIGYALGAGTTVSAEALQFGVKSFVFDVEPAFRTYYYRQFPGLTARTGGDVIGRIEAIESGRERYDFDAFRGLIEMSGRDFFSIVREEMGLSPHSAAQGDHITVLNAAEAAG